MNISIDTEKTFEKIQHLSLMKKHRKHGLQESYLNKIKDIFRKYKAKNNSILKY